MTDQEQPNDRLTLTEQCAAMSVAGQPGADPELSALIGVSDLEGVTVGVSLTLVIDGLIVRGNIGGSESFARRLDRGIEDSLRAYAAEHPSAEVGEAVDVFLKTLRGSFIGRAQRQRAAEDSTRSMYEAWAEERGVTDYGDAKLNEMPRDLALKVIASQARIDSFTLDNAVIVAGLGSEVAVGTMRVRASSVSAWWTTLGPSDAHEDM